jgi:hypothetical protein
MSETAGVIHQLTLSIYIYIYITLIINTENFGRFAQTTIAESRMI